MDPFAPRPVRDTSMDDDEDPRSRALELLMKESGSRGMTISPDQLGMLAEGGPRIPDEYIPDRPYTPPTPPQEGQGSSSGNENPMANVPMMKRKPYEGPQRTPDELRQLFDEVDKRAQSPEEYQQGAEKEYGAKDHPTNWPPTAEQFEMQYGRAPATDSEMHFYYGKADGSYNLHPRDEYGRRFRNMPPFRRFEDSRQ